MNIEKYYEAVKTAKNALYELENNFTNDGHVIVNEDSFTIAKKAKASVETMKNFENFNIDKNEYNEIINWNNLYQFNFRKMYKAEIK